MRRSGSVFLAAIGGLVMGGLVMGGSAKADYVPPFKGNDTGGIISASLAGQVDFRVLAGDHCAQYNKAAVFISHDRRYGGYSSFSCRRVPAAYFQKVLRVRY